MGAPLPRGKLPVEPVSGDFFPFPSFFLSCGVTLAQITLDLGMEERRRETPSRGRDHSGRGETTKPEPWVPCSQCKTGLGMQKQHCPRCIKRLKGTKAMRPVLFLQISLTSLLKTEPSCSTPHKQVASEALRCFKDAHTSIIASTPRKECKTARRCHVISLTAGAGRLLLAPM